jgi:protein O-mannosyl-transferase
MKWLTKPWLPWLGLAGLTFVAYSPALNGGFVWDDVIIYMLAQKSLSYFWTSPYQPDYWPVTYSVLFVLWNVFHANTWGYHLANLGLHLVNVGLWSVILRQLQLVRGRWLALAVFALHPLQVESVAYIFQLKTLLGTTFFLASLAWYLDSRARPRLRSDGLSLGSAFLALFAKTSTAMLPATLVLAELARPEPEREKRPPWRKRALTIGLRVLPFVVISAVGTLVTLRFNQAHYQRVNIWDAGFPERLLTAGLNVWFYVYKVVVPWHYTVAYPRVALSPSQWTSYLPLAAVLLALGLAWWKRRALEGTLFPGLMFYGLNIFPALGFTNVFFMKWSLVSDHWAYLASMGLIVPLCVGLSRLTERLAPVRAVLLAGLAAVSWFHARAFADEETLWQTTLRESPNADIAHSSLALLRFGKGRYPEALAYYLEAVRLRPDNDEAQFGLGCTYGKLGDQVKAEAHYRTALALNPWQGKAANGLGVLLTARKEWDEARLLLERAIEAEPDFYEARNNLALLYSDTGRSQDALEQLRIAVQLKPRDDSAYVNLGSLYLRLKRPDDAERALRRALELNPTQAMVHFNLAVMYEDRGDRPRARAALQEGLRLMPDNEQARRRLAALQAGPP